MSTPAPPVFDPAAAIASRNTADQLRREGKEVPATPAPQATGAEKPDAPAPQESHEPSPRLSRSQRRVENQLRRENGELAGRLAEMERRLNGGEQPAKPAPAAETDPEPKRAQFPDDASFNRALGKWDARQEAAKAVETVEKKQQIVEEQRQYNEHVQAMAHKCTEDMAEIEDWDEWKTKSLDDDDQPEFTLGEHPVLAGLLATSDQQARVLRYWAQHPKDLQKMLDLTGKQVDQIQAFRRLEGKVEVMYPAKQKAAQAPETKTPPKDRTHPAEATPQGEAGRTAGSNGTPKPRPSTEVTARGGAPAPDSPAPGSKEWMAERNRAQYGR